MRQSRPLLPPGTTIQDLLCKPIQHFESGGSVEDAPALDKDGNPMTWAQRMAAAEPPPDTTRKPTQTVDQFLAKYKDWVDDKGNFRGDRANGSNGIGDAAYTARNGIENQLNGKNAAQYFNENIGLQKAPAPAVDGGSDYDHGGAPAGPTFNDSVDASYHHNESGYQWDKIRPFVLASGAMLTAGALAPGMAAGAAGDVAALAPGQVSALTGGTVATPGAATGLAGKFGMDAGLAANAVNSGALNAAMTGIRGGNIGEMAKSGLIGAAMSPVATTVSNAAAGAMPTTWNPNLVKGLASVAGNTASGGAGAALTGKDIGTGLRNGAVNGAVGALGSYVGNMAKTETTEMGKPISNFAGSAANGVTQAALRGNLGTDTLANIANAGASQYVGDQVADATGSVDMGQVSKMMASAAARGKPITLTAAIQAVLNSKINGTVSGALTSVFNGKQPGRP